MSLAIVKTRGALGVAAPIVNVEAHLSSGLPRFSIVGLPEATVKESKDRVRSAILTCHFKFHNRVITINLAPANVPKQGGRFDLPIALGMLLASKQIRCDELEQYEFAGELALSGELKPIQGILPFAIATRNAGRTLIIPESNAEEASLPGDIKILPAKHLLDVCAHLSGQAPLRPYKASRKLTANRLEGDIQEVKGQAHAKRALEIAAAGGHSLLMIGPPGTGKTMLASRLPSLLPELSIDEALDVAAVRSIAGKPLVANNWRQRPFRSPHHTASSVALVGGGNPPQPGEISLAHRGVLFLDELPEFSRKVLEALREPLESDTICISRAGRQVTYPAAFQLIAAMNPCPCGHLGNPREACRCNEGQIQRYRAKLSGPLLDRIDMHLEVPALPSGILGTKLAQDPECSADFRERVQLAREQQFNRTNSLNSQLKGKPLESICELSVEHTRFLDMAMDKLRLSARAYHRILRLARTIADLAGTGKVEKSHLQEAISYRRLDRKTGTEPREYPQSSAAG